MRSQPITRPAVARPDEIRGRNLTSVLTAVHHDGPLTRAELTSRLGLGRSTIGALVAELTALGLVEESVPTGGPQSGRPSHLVGPHPNGPCVLAVDICIDNVAVAAVGIGGTILRRWQTAEPTVLTPALVADKVVTILVSLADQSPPVLPVGIGISVPGTVDRRTGKVGVAPNLGWHDVDMRDLLLTGIPVVVGNDADLAVLAEHVRGSGRACEDLVFLMGRYGVGAGIIAGGMSLLGTAGRAGEIGHNVIDPAGRPCHCGQLGCLETYVGEEALLAQAGLPEVGAGGDVDEVFRRARSGDPRSCAAIRQAATSLGEAVAVLANLLDPRRVVLGGLFGKLLAECSGDIVRALDARSLDTSVELTAPGLGDDSALLGAAEIAFGALLSDPLSARAAVG
ncbi:MAG: ROK family transcriptional regulator [Actinomycetota bacterium]|nr:ROK family transcriptional regulator [Actinomycetota bacterium]